MRRMRLTRSPSRSRRHKRGAVPRQTLRFTPTAWAKLLYLRDLGPTEVGGFGLSRPGDPLLVEDFCLVRQRADPAYVAFEDTAVADFFDEQVDQGRPPEEFARIWIHTHPGDCPLPSFTDERTFDKVFGRCEWSVMFIVSRGGSTYGRLRIAAGPGCERRLRCEVDYSQPFAGSDQTAWEAEYVRCVLPQETVFARFSHVNGDLVPQLSDPFDAELSPLGWDFPQERPEGGPR